MNEDDSVTNIYTDNLLTKFIAADLNGSNSVLIYDGATYVDDLAGTITLTYSNNTVITMTDASNITNVPDEYKITETFATNSFLVEYLQTSP